MFQFGEREDVLRILQRNRKSIGGSKTNCARRARYTGPLGPRIELQVNNRFASERKGVFLGRGEYAVIAMHRSSGSKDDIDIIDAGHQRFGVAMEPHTTLAEAGRTFCLP